MKIIETDRLYLQGFTIEDAENMYLLNADPDVIKFTGDVAFKSIDEAKNLIKNYDHYQKYGFGRWSVFLRDTNEYIGWCGLKYSPDKDEYDIGFRFFKEHWNNGYATEAAIACIEFGFSNFTIQRIIGRAMSSNIGSVKVLEKVGLTFVKKCEFAGEEGVLYMIEKIK